MKIQAEQIYKSFIEKAKYYLRELDFYGKFQFSQHPLDGLWSMGQLYDLLIQGTTSFHLREVQNCIERKNGEVGGKKTFKGKVVFKFNTIPFKIKWFTAETYLPQEVESPWKTKDDLYKFLKVMSRVAKEIDAAGTFDYKTKHPVLGMLNALEWFQLIDIHYKCQKKLKKKLDPFVRSHSKELASELEEDR